LIDLIFQGAADRIASQRMSLIEAGVRGAGMDRGRVICHIHMDAHIPHLEHGTLFGLQLDRVQEGVYVVPDERDQFTSWRHPQLDRPFVTVSTANIEAKARPIQLMPCYPSPQRVPVKLKRVVFA